MRFIKFKAKAEIDSPIRLSDAVREHLQHARLFAELDTDHSPRRIGLCACRSGAGVSTVAFNLAVMLSERTQSKVALVEANLRSPVLAKSFSLAAEPGFAAFAEGRAGEEAFHALPGLDVHALVADTTATPLPLLLAAAARLPSLSKTFRHIVVDLPPLLEYPDTGMIAAGLDGVLLVIEAEETRWQVAREAKKRLDVAGPPLLGAILNKKPHYIPKWLYGLL
jgi:protein-tyrosine kinase